MISDLKNVVEKLNGQLRKNPKDAKAYFERGWAKSEMGDYKSAVADYKRAIKFSHDYMEAYYNKALAFVRIGEHRRAIADLDMAIKLALAGATANQDIQLSDAYFHRAIAKATLGKLKDAKSDYDKVLDIKSNDGIAWCNRGHIKFALSDYKGALMDWGKAIKYARGLKDQLQPHINEAMARMQK